MPALRLRQLSRIYDPWDAGVAGERVAGGVETAPVGMPVLRTCYSEKSTPAKAGSGAGIGAPMEWSS